MQPFDYVVPRDFAEASALLAGGNGTVRALQGGTDLIVRARAGAVHLERIVDLKHLPGMRSIQSTPGGLRIGAACTMNQVAGHSFVQSDYGLLAQACNSVASYQLRNRATIGGNCCNASPAADTAPALYCLEAQAEIFGPTRVRCLPIDAFFTGPGRTALGAGEILTALILPPPLPGAHGTFNKLGRTRLGDISIVSVGIYAGPLPTGDSRAWRITLGAVGPTPLRAPEAEAALVADASPTGVAAAAALAAEAARPIGDLRAGAEYRRAMVEVLTRRGIETVLGTARAAAHVTPGAQAPGRTAT